MLWLDETWSLVVALRSSGLARTYPKEIQFNHQSNREI